MLADRAAHRAFADWMRDGDTSAALDSIEAAMNLMDDAYDRGGIPDDSPREALALRMAAFQSFLLGKRYGVTA